MLIVVQCVYVCFSLKYLKRTVIRILLCCRCVYLLCEQAVPSYKTNSTIEHITPSFRCFISFFFKRFVSLFTPVCFFFSLSVCRILFAKSYASFFFPSSLFLFFCCFCFGLMMIMYMVCIL
jgi:hypothetical protein